MTAFYYLRMALIAGLLLCTGLPAYADLDPEYQKQLAEFDVSLSAQEVLLVEGNNLTLQALNDLVQSVGQIKSRASDCIATSEAGINKVGEDINLLGKASAREVQGVVDERSSMRKAQLEFETQLSTCRLLVLRSNKLVESAQLQQQALIASQLFSRNKTLLDNLGENYRHPAEGLGSLRDFVISTAGLDIVYEHRYYLSSFILLSVVGTLMFRRLLLRGIARREKKARRSFSRQLLMALMTCSKHYMLVLLFTSSFAIYFLYLGLSFNHFPFVSLVSMGLFLHLMLVLTLRVVLDPVKPATPLISLPTNIAQGLVQRLRLLAKLLFVGFLIFSASNLHDFPDAVIGLLRNIYIALLVMNLCWSFWLLGYIKGMANTHLIRAAMNLVLLSSMFADWAGYSNLANFILIGIIGTLMAWMLTHLIVKLWTEFFDSLDDGEFGWQQFLRGKMGVQPGEYLPGSMWFRFTFGLVVWSIFIIAILKIWGLTDRSLISIQGYITEGFNAGPVHIVPLKIILALLVFAVFLSFVGWVKRRLDSSWLNRARMDRGSKESTITLTGYIGVVIAILVGLSVAGVKLSNLALIAGALSVGIGFGLQNVVNNFVAGIVLLFERPIKTGDWIVVQGTEGYVKKIQLSSTLIQTFDRADIIVPNSEIITSQVTNWTLSDSIGRIKVPIRAGYGSDPREVEKVLLKIAHKHPMVVCKSLSVDKPWVLFQQFGESAMHFELRCFISDIDSHMSVISEINFAIAAAFKKAGIVIPFPQTDMHVKSSELSALTTDV